MSFAMRWWCIGVMLVGLVLAGAAFVATDLLAVEVLTLFGGGVVPMTAPLRFAAGLMGAVTFGWGASLLAVAQASVALAPDLRTTLWRRIGWAVLAWYVLDSAISVATGFWLNAVSNTVLLAWFWWAARR